MKLALVAAVCVLLAGSSVFGAVIGSLTAPTGPTVMASSPDIAPAGRYTGIANRPGQWIAAGESFRNGTGGLATGATVNAFTMKMIPGSTFASISGQAMQATVITLVDDNSAVLTGTLTPWSIVGNLPTFTDATTPVYVTFEIPAFTVVLGTQYGVLVNFANQAANNVLGDGTQNGDGGFVESGNSITGDSLELFAVNNSGLAGSFSGDTDDNVFWAQNIPEPATMSLLVLGGLAALIRRKR